MHYLHELTVEHHGQALQPPLHVQIMLSASQKIFSELSYLQKKNRTFSHNEPIMILM